MAKFLKTLKKSRCGKRFKNFLKAVKEYLYDLFVVVLKNLRIRRRRYVASLLEILTPILISIILASYNTRGSLLRFDPINSHKLNKATDKETGFDMGQSYNEEKITVKDFRLCGKEDGICIIGFVADDATKAAVFDDPNFLQFFNQTGTSLEQFPNEKSILDCIKDPENCKQLYNKRDNLLNFRGAVIFESGVTSKEVSYKIRLLEKYYDQLLHVHQTKYRTAVVRDKEEFGEIYVYTGFASMQLLIDRRIISAIQKQTGNTYIDIDNPDGPTCKCGVVLKEIPHRANDQFHDQDRLTVDDPDFVQIDPDHEDEGVVEGLVNRTVVVSVILVLSFSFLIPAEQRLIVSEKEGGLTVLLQITGMTHRMQWFGHLLTVVCTYSVTLFVMVFILVIPFSHDQGAVFEEVTPTMLYLLLLLYVVAMASVNYMFSVFFNRPVLAITVSVTVWTVTYIFPVYTIQAYYYVTPLWLKLILCLHPSIALQIALEILISQEKDGIFTYIFNLGKAVRFDSMRLLYVYALLIIDIFAYMTVTIYLDRVMKQRYGTSKPWYYPFLPREWVSNRSSSKVSPIPMPHHVTDAFGRSIPEPGIEPFPENAEASIVTRNLTKKYGKVVGVEGLNLTLSHGEIFCLLGHNGAGKSTTLGLLCGYVPPSSGTATVLGYDITTHMVQIQAVTGMCPQMNALYDDLTPLEHLLIFGQLRGLRGTEADDECSELLDKLRLTEVKHLSSRKLSKGDKRKLSLGLAIIGGPKVVILDEPTGGMDYYSRRAVWDLLLKIRPDHTIIFSTHFMDEAELLGDKIGILSSGKLQVFGSHAFLRRYFGFGYTLKMAVDPEKKPDREKIVSVVKDSISSAHLNTLPLGPYPNRYVAVHIPEKGYSTEGMSGLFVELAKVKDALGIVGFSLSATGVDEIFLELTRKLGGAIWKTDEKTVIEIGKEEGEEENPLINLLGVKRSRILPVIQFLELLKKKVRFTARKKMLIFLQLTIPMALFFVSFLSHSWQVDVNGRDTPPLPVSLAIHKKPISFYHPTEEYTPKILESVLGPSATRSEAGDLESDYTSVDYVKLRNRHLVGLNTNHSEHSDVIVAFFTTYNYHSAPLALNMYSNLLVKKMDITRKISMVNHPLPHPYFKGPRFFHDAHAHELFAVTVTMGMSLLVAGFLVLPLEERLNQVQHLQFMTGLSSPIYWVATFVWDFFLILILITTVLLFTIFYKPTQVFTRGGREDLSTICLMGILLSFAYSGLMFSYTISHFPHSVIGGFSFLVVMTIIFGVLVPFFTAAYMPIDVFHKLQSFFKPMPIYSLASAIRKYGKTVLMNAECNHFTEEGKLHYCSEDREVSVGQKMVDLKCCTNCPQIPGSHHCIDQFQLVRTPWSTVYSSYDEYVSNFTENLEILGIHEDKRAGSAFGEISWMICVGVGLTFLNIFLDSDAYKYLEACVLGLRGTAFQTEVEDDDVLDEMDRVDEMVTSKKLEEDALVAHNLCKTYGVFPAVHNVSFGVHHGECFGILGVNGAGKSTLFRVLTAASTETYGNVYANGCSLTSERRKLMTKMGYSPHTGMALISYMTPKETLHLFARLRGLSIKVAKQKTEELMTKLGMEKFANVTCTSLSGGTKRKLSVAIAIIAEPPIVLFDEPTSASDPTSRRLYWEVLKSVKKSGQTVIFNSHRIHELEALSSRLGILVDGKFQCIGKPSHLKAKFGKGYKLMIKLAPGPAENQGYVSSLSDTVVTTFNPCTLRDRRRSVVLYVIHDHKISWDFLFQSMGHIKLRYNDLVEDFAFSDTTMEEVFLSFVVLQNCGRRPDAGAGCC